MRISKTLTVVLGLSLCGVSAYFLYLYLKKDDDDDDFIDTFERTAKFKVLEIPVPADMVKVLIGRNGNNIRHIQDQSNTRINFKDSGVQKICVIRGCREACNVAEGLIQEFLTNQPVLECEDMWVPSACVARIIGRYGDRIRELSMVSGAGITFDDNKASSNRRCTIKGTKEQILVAKSLITEIMEKVQNIDASLLKREPRLPKNSPLKIVQKVERTTSPIPADSQFEVYVSAMIDPSRFWLQIVGPKATELDVLVEEMSDYYRKEENRDNHILGNVSKGDLVAAVFKYDNKWYRAEILNINDEDGRVAELYFVDYGDIDFVPVGELYELRTEFLRLHFQAIECYLAKVDPVGDSWSLEAIDKFEEWSHVGQWKKLSAKINGYSIKEKTRAKREGSPVPGVDLFNVNDEQDIDIAQELVKQGFAVFKKDYELVSSSRATSNSNISVASSS